MKLHGELEELIAERKITGGLPAEVTFRLRHHSCGGLAVMSREGYRKDPRLLRGPVDQGLCQPIPGYHRPSHKGQAGSKPLHLVTPSLGWVLELSWALPGKARISVHDMEAKFPLALGGSLQLHMNVCLG